MGAALLLPYAVHFEDGRTVEVTADQRDLAALELESWYDGRRAMVNSASRWMAWHALKRKGATDLSWPKWNAVVVEVADVLPDDEEGEGEQGAPPGRRAARERRSST